MKTEKIAGEKFRLLSDLFIIKKDEQEAKNTRPPNRKRKTRTKVSNRNTQSIKIEGTLVLRQFYVEACEIYEKYFPDKEASLSFTDLIDIAFDKLTTEQRKWNIQKYPNALNQLRLAYMSELKNMYKTERKNRKYINLEDNTINETKDADIIQKVSVSNEITENDIDNKIKLKEIKKYVSEEMPENFKNVFEGMEKGLQDKEIAKEYGLTIKRVEKIKSKMRGKLQQKYPNYKKAD